MALPTPIWSDDDMEMACRDTRSLIQNTLNDDPTKLAVLQAIVSCQVRLGHDSAFGWDIGDDMAQRCVCFYLSLFIRRGGRALINSFQVQHPYRDAILSLSNFPGFLRSPVGNVTDENL